MVATRTASPKTTLAYLCALLLVSTLACRPADDPEVQSEPALSPNARPELVATLREDLQSSRGPRDGGGHAWLEEKAEVFAGESGRFPLVYEAGPLGIADSGMLFLQVSPFWGWSTPQVEAPEAPGFTQVSTDAAGVELEPQTLGSQLLGIRITGRELKEGERIRILYGAGPAGATVDRFAESASPFWIAVDGDGDGVRGLIPNPPTVNVLAGPPALFSLLVPTTARPGTTFRITAALLDRSGNAGIPVAGHILLELPPGLEGPHRIDLSADTGGVGHAEIVAHDAGTFRISAQGPAGLQATSNPMIVSDAVPRVLWADLHGHSGLSDGTGTPEDFLRYARDVAALDAVALTDHDHWGMRPLSQNPTLWQTIRSATEAFHQPDLFVTLLGYEWTNWLHGHRHVLYFDGQGEVLSSLDPDYSTPQQLWAALRGRDVLTFAHHSAGGPIATNWTIPPDAELEPVTEIVSVHGSSEALDSPGLIYSPVAGNFARDALSLGYRLGFIGSGDSHDGHPGLAHLASPSSGLAGILSESLTREGILEALRARRVYATNGARMFLSVSLRGRSMGSVVQAARELELSVEVVGEDRIERVEAIDGHSVRVLAESPGGIRCSIDTRVDLRAGDFLYIRAIQGDGGVAWSSPFFAHR